MKKWKTVLAAGLAAALLGAGCLLAGCSDSGDTASTSGSEQDNWIGDAAAVELVQGLSQEETGLSLATDSYQFEVDEEVGDIGEQTCYLVHAYLVEDGTGTRHLEESVDPYALRTVRQHHVASLRSASPEGGTAQL